MNDKIYRTILIIIAIVINIIAIIAVIISVTDAVEQIKTNGGSQTAIVEENTNYETDNMQIQTEDDEMDFMSLLSKLNLETILPIIEIIIGNALITVGILLIRKINMLNVV